MEQDECFDGLPVQLGLLLVILPIVKSSTRFFEECQ